MATTYTQDLLDRATAYLEQPLTARRYNEGLSTITALYSEITGELASKCRQCQYSNYLAVVQAYIRQATRELHPETMEDSKYTLAPGVQNETFVHESYGKAVTRENLTDEDAEFFISKGFDKAFILKNSEQADAGSTAPEAGKDAEPTEREKQLEQSLTSARTALTDEQGAHGDAKAKLATEKTAHKATKDALTAEKKQTASLAKQLADLTDQLAKSQAVGVGEPSIPVAPVVDPATQA